MTVAKTPQQNGLTERNRTICENVRSMLSHSKLLKIFWGEAVHIAVEIINLSPAYALEMDDPKRMWTGKDVNYKHVNVSECQAFAHIPKNEMSKFDGFLVIDPEIINY